MKARGRLFIAMELLDGIDLRTLLRAKRSITLMDKLGLMLQICDGVAFAHSKEIVHRDLTPSNIRVLPNGHVKIMDFGLVRHPQIDERLDLAPERLRVEVHRRPRIRPTYADLESRPDRCDRAPASFRRQELQAPPPT